VSITRAEARIVIEAAIAHAESIGQRVAVAVIDDTGRPVSADQMDGTKFKRDEFAQGKAFAALLLQQSTNEAKEMMTSNPTRFYSLLSMFPGQLYLSYGGGVPLFDGDELVGAVGVAGGKMGDDDAMCDSGIEAWRQSRDGGTRDREAGE
jgi:glc operon protein GlcG